MKLSKSEQEVLDAIKEIKNLPYTKSRFGFPVRYKRHERAIAALKSKGIIFRGKDSILRLCQ